jgi:DNA invertase Pin-like site-specific DNA recombinase
MKKAVIYARVSTKRQADDGLPVESQLDHCRSKAAAMGLTVVREFVDGGISGTTDKRPAFQDALTYCAMMDVDYFLCWSSSRFARNHLDAGHYKGLLEKYGTRLIYSSTEVDIRTDDGWFIDAIGSVIDERYSRQVSTDTKRSMLKAARDGFYLGGRVPFGYVAVPEGKRKRLTLHPTEGPLVKQLFTMALNGWGTKMIAIQLNTQGLSMRGQRWGKGTVNYVLKNEVYAGQTVFNRTSKGRKPNPPSDWVRVNSHEGVVSPGDFEKVQTMVSDRQPMNVGGQPRSNFAFTGLLKCGVCGAGLQTCSGSGRSKVYHYYGCRDSLTGKHRCAFKKFRAELFDDWMLGRLLDEVLTPERMVDVFAQAAEQRREWVKDRSGRRTGLVAEMRRIEKARGNLYGLLELHGVGAPNLGDLSARLRELNEQLKRLELAMVDLDAEPISPGDLPDADPHEVAEVLRGVVMDCQDPKKLRAFVASFVKEIVVSDATVEVEYLPECLVRLNGRTRVHSAASWLPVLGTPRTMRVTVVRPPSFKLLSCGSQWARAA